MDRPITWSYEVTFRANGSQTTVSGGPFDTFAECNAAKWRALDAFGYKEPKWWEFWRHGEPTRKREGSNATPPR